VSDQKSEQTSAELGSLGAGASVPDPLNAQSEPVAASAISVESPGLAPKLGEAEETAKVEASNVDVPKVEATKPDTPKPDTLKADAPKADAPKADAPKVDEPKVRAPGKLITLSGDRSWDRNDAGPDLESEPSAGMFGKRRISALAAVVALAAATGALGGALATAGFGHLSGDDSRTASSRALEEQVARLDADVAALKVSVDHTTKVGMSQFNKTSDRLDKVEKAQAEPAAKIAKLSEAVDKLRATPAAPATVAAAPAAAAKDITGSIAPPVAAPKVEVARLPTIEGWILRDVANGGALIEGRQGVYEVYAGDPVPGLGRVDAIRKQDGRWVVVTSKGLITPR
jgi:hypothetical protein